MVRTCDMMSGVEKDRMNSDEVTLPYLQRAKGRGFLTLLKHFMLEDTSSIPSEPIFLSSPRWDRMIGKNRKNLSNTEKILQAYSDGIRNEFICHFLLNTLRSFHGYPPDIRDPESHGRLFEKEMIKLLGKSKAKSMQREVRAFTNALVAICEGCQKSEIELGKGKFMCCSTCKQKVNRRIFYCSKECQNADWTPRHKIICGKKMTLKDAQATAVAGSQPPPVHVWENPMSCNENIGPARTGYTRSPALLHQINTIHLNEAIDYFLIPAKSSKEPYAVVFQDLAVKTFFRKDRATAMASGDRDAVAAIGQLLVRQASGISRREIFGQLEQEYGFDVEAAVAELDQWSIRETGGLSKIEVDSTEVRGIVDTARGLFNNFGPESMGTLGCEELEDFMDMLRGLH